MPLRPHRWLLSATALLFALLLAGLTIGPLAPLLLRDADTLWHIRNGQHMLATGHISVTDWFSATVAGQPWIAWEWLWDLAVGWLARFGLNGPVWLSALIVAATFTLLFRALLRRSHSLPWAICLTMLSLAAASIHLLARPHLVTWLLALVFWLVLDGVTAGNQHPRRLWLLVPLTALWANLHPGFILGIGLIALFFTVAAVRKLGARSAQSGLTVPLTAVGAATAFAALLNPFGGLLYLHLFQYLGDSFFQQHVNELQAPDFHTFAPRAFALLLVFALVAVARRRAPLTPGSLATLLAGVALGLAASRNLPIAAMLVSLAIAPTLRRQSTAAGGLARVSQQELAASPVLWCSLAALASLALLLSGSPLMNARLDAVTFPVQASAYLVQHQLPAPVLLPDRWSGVLIYANPPGAHPLVAIDDRHDLYGPEVMRNYLKIMGLQQGWEEKLEATKAQTLLLPVESALAIALSGRPGSVWHEVYRDSVAVIFVRGPQA